MGRVCFKPVAYGSAECERARFLRPKRMATREHKGTEWGGGGAGGTLKFGTPLCAHDARGGRPTDWLFSPPPSLSLSLSRTGRYEAFYGECGRSLRIDDVTPTAEQRKPVHRPVERSTPVHVHRCRDATRRKRAKCRTRGRHWRRAVKGDKGNVARKWRYSRLGGVKLELISNWAIAQF